MRQAQRAAIVAPPKDSIHVKCVSAVFCNISNPHEGAGRVAGPLNFELSVVSCDVPGRCSLKRVVHPGDFRHSESSSNEQSDRKVPNGRAQECAKLPGKSRAAVETSPAVWLVAAKGGGGRWPERASGPRVGSPRRAR